MALPLALPLAAADLTPSAKTAPAAPVSSSPSAQSAATAVPTFIATPAVPSPATVTAKAEAPPLPAELSGTAEVLAPPVSSTASTDDPYIAEEVGEDGGIQAKSETPDLTKADSETLASISSGVDKEANDVYFDPSAKQVIPDATPGSWRVNVDALYYELAKRTLKDNKDKAARQAFALTLFKDADRAKYAKDLAFDDNVADTVIAQLEGGRARARMDLQALAEKGNRKARVYLGMDKPMEHVEAGALSTTAAPVALSGTASKPAAATALSATAAPSAPTTPTPAPKK